jgi:hypothetical protein
VRSGDGRGSRMESPKTRRGKGNEATGNGSRGKDIAGDGDLARRELIA